MNIFIVDSNDSNSSILFVPVKHIIQLTTNNRSYRSCELNICSKISNTIFNSQ